MFHRSDRLPILGLVFMHLAMAHQLLSGRGVLAFGETGELFRSNRPSKAELLGELALPFALNGVALLPVVLFGGSELFRMIGLRLACGERFGDGQHGSVLTSHNEVLLLVDIGRRSLGLPRSLRRRRFIGLRWDGGSGSCFNSAWDASVPRSFLRS